MGKRGLLPAAVACVVASAAAMKQSWTFKDEDSAHFFIERFGVGPSGRMDVHVSHVELGPGGQGGLLFVHQENLWQTVALLSDVVAHGAFHDPVEALPARDTEALPCILEQRRADRWIDLTDVSTWNVTRRVEHVEKKTGSTSTIDRGLEGALEMGFYYIFYAQCRPGTTVSFHMDAVLQNGAHNYLSVGDAPLPSVYLATSLLFSSVAVAWWWCLVRNLEHVQRVHWLMAVLVSVKAIALFAEAMRAYYMKRHGDTLTAWTAVTYTFLSLKGVLLFSALMLIGTGWTLLKPHLSQNDKSVLSLVLVLQVVSNVAQILEAETAVGTRAWVSWRDILIIADVACCAAVLLPIVWSIRKLRIAAATDGKAFANLQKLTQFRSFYLLVICYIYVTRLALQLLRASLPYYATWVAVAVSELAALGFFTITGYRFRPVPRNPYLEVPMHEDDLEEFALGDDEDDLDFHSDQRNDIHKFAYGAPVQTKASYSTKRQHSLERVSYAKTTSDSINSDL